VLPEHDSVIFAPVLSITFKALNAQNFKRIQTEKKPLSKINYVSKGER